MRLGCTDQGFLRIIPVWYFLFVTKKESNYLEVMMTFD